MVIEDIANVIIRDECAIYMQVVDGKIKVQRLNLKVEALKFFIIQSLPFSIQVVIVISNPR